MIINYDERQTLQRKYILLFGGWVHRAILYLHTFLEPFGFIFLEPFGQIVHRNNYSCKKHIFDQK